MILMGGPTDYDKLIDGNTRAAREVRVQQPLARYRHRAACYNKLYISTSCTGTSDDVDDPYNHAMYAIKTSIPCQTGKCTKNANCPFQHVERPTTIAGCHLELFDCAWRR